MSAGGGRRGKRAGPLTPAQIRGHRGGSRQAHGRPRLSVMPTTLWEYPSQQYGAGGQGDQNYVGATPSWVIWQLLTRYTREGDLVVDPMCGSGTTLDVAREMGRKALGYDVSPAREDVFRADARSVPLEDGKADFVFVDPPYSTHVKYSEEASCIGRLDAADPGRAYYRAMESVIGEIARVMRPGAHMGLYVSDSYKKRAGGSPLASFMPIGFELFGMLRARLEPVDIVCVVRHNAKLEKGNWRKAAEEGGFMLRGFNYLFICRKARAHEKEPARRGARGSASVVRRRRD